MKDTSNIDNKRIAKNTILLYCRMLLMMIISLYTSRVVLQALGIDDYGIYNVVGGIVTILSFLNISMASATQRFLNYELGRCDIESVKRVFATSVRLHFMIGIIILLTCELLSVWYLNNYMVIPKERIVAANWVLQLSILTLFVTILNTPYNAVIIAHEKMNVFAFISIIEAVLKLIVVFLLVICPIDKLVLYALLNFIVILLIRLWYYYYGKHKFTECRVPIKYYSKSMMKQMLGFSGWTIFGSLGTLSHTQGIALVINYFFGVVVNAAQGISNQVITNVSQFVINFMMAVNPQLVKSYASKDISGTQKLIVESSKMALYLSSLISIPIILETPYILSVWLGNVPDYTVSFIRVILITSLCNSFAQPLSTAIGATGEIRNYQIVLTALGWMHIPLAIIAFLFGAEPVGAIYIYLCIVLVQQIVRLWFVYKKINLSLVRFLKQVIFKSIVVILVSSLLSILIKELLPRSSFFPLLNVIISLLFVSICVMVFGYSKVERKKILSILVKKIGNEKME